MGDHECIHCGECIDKWSISAITFKAGKYTITGNSLSAHKKSKRLIVIAWFTAHVLLIGGLFFFNQEIPAGEEQSNDSSITDAQQSLVTPAAEIGKDPGILAPPFTALLFGSDRVFDLSAHAGKVVIINFWATWCTPCINDLPYLTP